MIRIALHGLRHHAAGFFATFLALFLGAVITVGCAGLLETGVRTAAPPVRLAAAPIVVTGDQRYLGTEQELVFPERVRLGAATVDAARGLPGVAAAVPDVSFPAVLAAGSSGRDEAAGRGGSGASGQGGGAVTGHGWSSARLAPYRLTAGQAPVGPGRIALDARLAERAGLRPGERISLLADGGTTSYQVSGLVTGAGDARTVFLSDAEADRLTAHPGTVDSIGVFTTPGADRDAVVRSLRDLVHGRPAVVLTGDDRGRAEDAGVVADGGDLVPLAAAFGGLSAMVLVFVVSATLGLSVRQRARELALLRAAGATPGQLRRLVVVETLVLAAIATAPAWWLGPRFGRWLMNAFAGAHVIPHAIAFRSGEVPLIVGTGTAVLTALAAGFVAASAAARARPSEALAEVALQQRRFSRVRLVMGLLCVAGGVLLAMGTARSDGPDAGGVATPAVMVWTGAFGLLAPPLCRAATAMLRRPLRGAAGLAGRLAADNLRARTARTAAAATPVMLATGLAIGLIYLQTTQTAGARAAFDETLKADLVVTSQAGGLPQDLVGAVRGLPGVAAASARVPSTGYLEPATPGGASDGAAASEGSAVSGGSAVPEGSAVSGEAVAPGDGQKSDGPQPTEVPLLGVTADGVSATTGLRAASGSLTALRGRTVVLPTRYAAGHRLGDRIAMRLGDGTTAALELVGTVEDRPGYETALVPARVLLAHTDSTLVPQILVRTAGGADRAAVTGAISGLAARYPGLQVGGRQVLASAQHDQDDTQNWMAWLVLAVAAGYATVAMVNAQVVATGERRREFTLQRLVGATRRQVMRMMAAEAAAVAATGVLLGTAVAVVTLVPVGISVLNSPMPAGSPLIWAAVAAAALLLTSAATLLPTAFLLRGRPTDPGDQG
jgi:putative ABC transport system permease protein